MALIVPTVANMAHCSTPSCCGTPPDTKLGQPQHAIVMCPCRIAQSSRRHATDVRGQSARNSDNPPTCTWIPFYKRAGFFRDSAYLCGSLVKSNLEESMRWAGFRCRVGSRSPMRGGVMVSWLPCNAGPVAAFGCRPVAESDPIPRAGRVPRADRPCPDPNSEPAVAKPP